MTISKEIKNNLCINLGTNLSTIRAKTDISQDGLASKLGITRQTITAIENKRRVMQWNTFVTLVLFFVRNDEVKSIMELMGIYTADVIKSLEI
jgi:DNA-binding XRE family transcriptional regulator